MSDQTSPSQDSRGATLGSKEPESAATVADGSAPDSSASPGATIAEASDLAPTENAGGAETVEHASSASTLTGPGSPASAPQAIPTIAGYEILAELGRGGMGVVYHARQVLLNRPCALKMILAGARADMVTSLRFLGEAEAVARLRHPNIVQIHHIGEADGLPFLELEYVEGGSLDQLLDGTPWPAKRAATLVEALARGVAEAHRLGTIHRDLKPANVLLDADGTPKVADFGLAKALDAQSGLTATDSILGSPSYMAPEQAGGKSRQVGPAADTYSLGAILYELLTGRPPFRGATVLETLEQVKHVEPVPPRRLVPGVPRDAETIALKCLEKDPSKRYPSAEALADDLRRFLDGEPIVARPVRPWERVVKWAKRRPALAASFVALHVLLAALLGLGVWSYAEINRSLTLEADARKEAEALAKAEALATDRAEEQTRRAEREAAIARERAEELRRRDYINRVNLALRESRDNNVARALELLDGCPEDLRAWEWHYVQRQCRLDLHTFYDEADSVNSVAFSPDGRLLATGSGAFGAPLKEIPGDVIVRDPSTGVEVFARRDLPEGVRAVAFSPDGSHLAVSHARDLVVWDLASGQERFRRTEPGDRDPGVAALAFSPDGRSLLAGYGQFLSADSGYARLLDAATGAEIGELLPGGESGVWSVAFRPDGRQVALSMSGAVQIRDVETRDLIHDLHAHDGLVFAVAFSPDGRLLASAGLDRTIRLHDCQTGQLLRTLTGHEGFVRAVAFSPDSRRLVSGAEDKTVKLWSVDSDRELATFYGHTHYVQAVAFNADGYRVASGGLGREVKLWFASPSLQLTYPYHKGWVRALAFRPDGRRVASASAMSHTRTETTGPPTALWDPVTGEVDQFLPTTDLFGLAFSPDGQHLATAELRGFTKVWDLETCTSLYTLGDLSSVRSIAFSPNGRHLATEKGDDRSVRVWEAGTGRLLHEFRDVGPTISSLAFSLDGRLVAAAPVEAHSAPGYAEASVVRVWDVESGAEVHRLEGHTYAVGGVAFFPDGRRLVSVGGVVFGGAAEIKIWDLATGRLIRDLTGHTDVVGAVAISPDGRRLATGSDDRTIKLWDTTTFEEVFTLRGHQSGVVALAFSPDGRRLVSGSIDRTAKVWDLDAPTLETLYRREAVAVVRPLFDQFLDPEQVAEAIRGDESLSEPIRREALDVAARLPLDALTLVRRAEAHAARGDWARAAEEAERAFALADDIGARLPTSEWIIADYYARSGAWDRVLDVLGRFVAQSPNNFSLCKYLAIAQLETGDEDGFRRTVEEVLERSGDRQSFELVQCCILGPAPGVAVERAVRIAEEHLANVPEQFQPGFRSSLGAVYYRAGRFEEAIRLLEQFEEAIRLLEQDAGIEGGLPNEWGESLRREQPKSWAFLAMAHHQLGHAEEATRWLEQLQAHPLSDGSQFFWNGVEFNILRREAEALIRGEPTDAP